MRYAMLFLFAIGCHGPKSADAAPPSKETIVQALERYDALAVKRAEATDGKVDGLAATVGNQTSELEAVKEELRAIKAQTATIEKYVKSMNGDVVQIVDLLGVKSELSIEVPKAPDPPQLSESDSSLKVDAPPAEAAGQRVSGPTLNGKPLDVAAVIKANYRRRWSHPGTIDSHLTEHGVAGFSGLDNETKERLHSALHEMGQTPAKAVVKERTVYRAPVPVQNCPSGQCPNARSYGYQQSRVRLFGRR